jgi:hypothetical protein
MVLKNYLPLLAPFQSSAFRGNGGMRGKSRIVSGFEFGVSGWSGVHPPARGGLGRNGEKVDPPSLAREQAQLKFFIFYPDLVEFSRSLPNCATILGTRHLRRRIWKLLLRRPGVYAR